MPRMNILDKNSLNEFQRPPEFTASQRKHCFILSKSLIEFIAKLRSPSNQIGFLLFKKFNTSYQKKISIEINTMVKLRTP